jgi:hypothetical protein
MLRLDEVVIGNGLSALVYAYCNDRMLIRVRDEGPPPFDFFEPRFDLTPYYFNSIDYELKSNSGVKIVGAPKRELWERLSFVLSLSGNMPFAGNVKAIRVNPEKKIVSVVGSGAATEISYTKLRVFDDTDLYGLDDFRNLETVEFLSPKKIKILDWLNVRSGCRHEHDHMYTGDDFVNEIYFYPSERVDGKHDLKDLVAISYLTREQLNDVEYSDTYARLKVRGIMKDHGIRGTRNGRDTKNPEKYKYYAIRIESAARDVFPAAEKNKYRDGDDIIFDTRSAEEVALQKPRPSYAHKLHERLVTI